MNDTSYADKINNWQITAQNLQDFTLTLDFKHKDGFLTRLEYRGDMSNGEAFTKDSVGPSKNQNSLTLGWIYAFSSKTP